MNALLYATNTNAQTLTANQSVNFGAPVRRYGRNINMLGGSVTVNGEGYYTVFANVTFEPIAAGTATLQIYENGIAIPGANETITVTANDNYSLSIPAAIRIKCCEEKVITASFNVAGSAVNASVLVEKA